MPGSAVFIPAPLPGLGILQRIKPVAGLGSGLDADLVRGQALPSVQPRFDVAPAVTPPPLWGDPTLAAYFFGA